eukprot:CAMPEP_0202451206 /NCGR_PEP_ID=MMETSP1360-20130828/9683_1 /ASSEMBLY_ACC=CAM_ASM_000848 /TAXON_ID=515479 /ORGANISM="Licmophora paradoxa, Strain CCMP2313" /LENGTH=348 /DNA_ID=CAMNT_0049069713 /DNA_START=1 /DNA_END=1044 /DNA_ORIENTATION=-
MSTQLNTLRADMSNRFDEMETRMDQMEKKTQARFDETEMKTQKQFAETFTVRIYLANHTDKVVGHGFVTQAASDSSNSGNNNYYQLWSNAHVFFAILDQVNDGTAIVLQFSGEIEVRIVLGDIFVGQEYPQKGKSRQDIGVAKFTLESSVLCSTGLTDNVVRWKIDVSSGNRVVGKGSASIDGPAMSSLHDNCRVKVMAFSRPGLSGCPIFDENKNIVGLNIGRSRFEQHFVSVSDHVGSFDMDNLETALFADRPDLGKPLRKIKKEEVRKFTAAKRDLWKSKTVFLGFGYLQGKGLKQIPSMKKRLLKKVDTSVEKVFCNETEHDSLLHITQDFHLCMPPHNNVEDS